MMRHVSTLLLVFLLFGGVGGSLRASVGNPQRLSASATLSHRGVKLKQNVELVISVRCASNPVVKNISPSPGLILHAIGHRQLLRTEEGEVWLFRYRIMATRAGDYEIPAISVLDGERSVETKPLFLHVSRSGDAPPFTAKELSIAVDIPPSLGEEVLKAAPQPTPKLEPTPKPRDERPFASRAGSTLQHFLKSFWEYPGG